MILFKYCTCLCCVPVSQPMTLDHQALHLEHLFRWSRDPLMWSWANRRSCSFIPTYFKLELLITNYFIFLAHCSSSCVLISNCWVLPTLLTSLADILFDCSENTHSCCHLGPVYTLWRRYFCFVSRRCQQWQSASFARHHLGFWPYPILRLHFSVHQSLRRWCLGTKAEAYRSLR